MILHNQRIEKRFREIVATAGTVFARKGFRRTLISDIAQEIGVSQGTIYNYFESKEALFEFTLQALYREDFALPRTLPVPTPQQGQELIQARVLVQEYRPQPTLENVLDKPPLQDVTKEISTMVRELYRQNVRFGTLLRMIERSADDYPKLYDFYYGEVRGPTISRWEEYIRARMEQGRIRHVPEPKIAARTVIEVTTWWARHSKGDIGPETYDEDQAIAGMIDFIVHSLTKDPVHVD